jgi:hypothetical protein
MKIFTHLKNEHDRRVGLPSRVDQYMNSGVEALRYNRHLEESKARQTRAAVKAAPTKEAAHLREEQKIANDKEDKIVEKVRNLWGEDGVREFWERAANAVGKENIRLSRL